MCFMALEDHEDELNSSTINDELQNIFEELYLDFEKYLSQEENLFSWK